MRAAHTNRAMANDGSSVMPGLFAAFALTALVALVLALRWERREFTRAGKGRSWLVVRLATLPIALVTAAIVVLPARAVSGMEALGVFYVLLLTAVPLAWLGLHALAGRLARPRLGGWDVVQLAVAPIAFVIAVALVAHQLQPLAWSIAREVVRLQYARAADAPAPHRLANAHRYATASGDVVTAQWQAPSDVRIERIDLVGGGRTVVDAGRVLTHAICQSPATIVLVRPADGPAPALAVYWRDAHGSLNRSLLEAPTPLDPTPFAVRWQDEHRFALPEPLPRQSVWLAEPGDRSTSGFASDAAQRYAPGEKPEMNCLRPDWASPRAVLGLRIRVERAPGGTDGPLWLEAVRTPSSNDHRGNS